jgi:hypothetical protein
MMIVSSPLLIVSHVSSILWTIGLTFLITGIVVLVVAEMRRAGHGRRYRY